MAPREDWTITNRWRFYVNIRFGVALNLAEGATAMRGMMNSMLLALIVFATGCTGFVTVSLFFLHSVVAMNPNSMNRVLPSFH